MSTHTASCPDGQYTAIAPTDHADRVCQDIQTCSAGEYEVLAPGLSARHADAQGDGQEGGCGAIK